MRAAALPFLSGVAVPFRMPSPRTIHECGVCVDSGVQRSSSSLSSALFRARIFSELIDSYRNCCIPSESTQSQLPCLDVISSRSLISSRSIAAALHERRHRHAGEPCRDGPTRETALHDATLLAKLGRRAALVHWATVDCAFSRRPPASAPPSTGPNERRRPQRAFRQSRDTRRTAHLQRQRTRFECDAATCHDQTS